MNVNFCKESAVHKDHAKDSANHLQKSRLCTSVPVIFVNLYFKIFFFLQISGSYISSAYKGHTEESQVRVFPLWL